MSDERAGRGTSLQLPKYFKLNSREKFVLEPGFQPWTSISLAFMLYHLSYPGSIDGTGPNFSLESNAIQGVVVCDTLCHHLTFELTS